MIALLQRVKTASVTVDKKTVADIGAGLLVYAAVQREDDEHSLARMGEKVLAYRMFGDGTGRMNQSVMNVQGEVLLVPQFTLAAELFDRFSGHLRANCAKVQTGIFGACMQVHSVNDGPVTFWLEV